jgi:hypothetical protein
MARVSSLMRRCARATFASNSVVFSRPSTMTFPAASAWTSGAPCASAAATPTTAGLSSMSTSTRSAISSASSRVGETTAAIGSPTNRTTSCASTGWLIGT